MSVWFLGSVCLLGWACAEHGNAYSPSSSGKAQWWHSMTMNETDGAKRKKKKIFQLSSQGGFSSSLGPDHLCSKGESHLAAKFLWSDPSRTGKKSEAQRGKGMGSKSHWERATPRTEVFRPLSHGLSSYISWHCLVVAVEHAQRNLGKNGTHCSPNHSNISNIVPSH